MTVQLFVNYLEGQTPGPLPPQARPAGVVNREPELREWQAIEHICRQGLYTGADHTGLLSPMFPAKTGLSFADAIAFVEAHPGFDLYLFDHGPQYRYYYFNIFEFAENVTPGILAKLAECLALVGETADVGSLGRSLPENTVHSNSWIGNDRVWTETAGRAIAIIDAVRASPGTLRSLCEPVVVNGRIFPHLPSVLERLVPYWLMTRGGISVKPYSGARPMYWRAACARSSGRSSRPSTTCSTRGTRPGLGARTSGSSSATSRWRSTASCAVNHTVYPWTGERIAPVR